MLYKCHLIFQVAVLFLISLHTSCALPMADNLNAVKTTSSKAALADNHTKIEAYDSIDLSDAMKSNAALQGLVRKYNETGINVVSLLYNQQMKSMYPLSFAKFIHSFHELRGTKLKLWCTLC